MSDGHDQANLVLSGCVSLRGLGLTRIPQLFIGSNGVLGDGMADVVDVRSGSAGGRIDTVLRSNTVTHLWLDKNKLGDDLEALHDLLSRVSASVEELSLCNVGLGCSKDAAKDRGDNLSLIHI